MVKTRFVKFRYLSISFGRRGETDRLLTPIRGIPASSFGVPRTSRAQSAPIDTVVGDATPEGHFLVEPIVQRHTFWECWSIPAPASWAISREDARVDVDAAPCLPTSGRQYRPRTVQCRSRRSFMKEMVGELSRCRRTHLIQINALTLIKINALTAVTY